VTDDDVLRLAEYALTAALVLVVVALVCDLVILTSRRRAPVRARTAVGGGAVPGEQDWGDGVAVEAATGDAAEDAAAGPAPPPSPRSRGLTAYATAFGVVAALLLTAYLVARMSVTGHGPFANQHEFAVSFAWGILVAYLVVEVRWRMRVLSVAVLPVAACLLLYAMQLDAGVAPLVPALQNNVLLSLHVGFAILAYGAACVSFGAAALYLLHPRLRLLAGMSRARLDEVGYRAAMVTFPLLTTMIVLGAIWADTAWGRYWGWDPKETAALVTWLIYGAFLHARVARGWRGERSAWLLVIGFAAILFAYFGNHFFGGLHSYA
jgi:ABC-type transport system involved in cytochrome c biogenesis permease subunit